MVFVTALLLACVRDWRPWRLGGDHGAWLLLCVAAAGPAGNAGLGRPGCLRWAGERGP